MYSTSELILSLTAIVYKRLATQCLGMIGWVETFQTSSQMIALPCIASNGNTLRGHQTEFRLLHVKRLISDYARVVIVARTTEWPLALADQGGPVDSTVQLL